MIFKSEREKKTSTYQKFRALVLREEKLILIGKKCGRIFITEKRREQGFGERSHGKRVSEAKIANLGLKKFGLGFIEAIKTGPMSENVNDSKLKTGKGKV